MSLRVVPVACLTDNYAYLVIDPSGLVAVVDPSEAAPVQAALAGLVGTTDAPLVLTEVWCTHHHLDHVGGIDALVAATPTLRVRGSRYDADHDRIPCITDVHADGDSFQFGATTVRVLNIPGHTLGAIAFVTDAGDLFSGDTLFLGGCGRVFEGTMPMMAASMRTLRALDPASRIFCGHEYTAANLRFAKSVEPHNPDIDAALADAEARAREGRPSVPGTLGAELRVNPFLRFDRPELANGQEPDASFAALREAKNGFRG